MWREKGRLAPRALSGDLRDVAGGWCVRGESGMGVARRGGIGNHGGPAGACIMTRWGGGRLAPWSLAVPSWVKRDTIRSWNDGVHKGEGGTGGDRRGGAGARVGRVGR